MEFDDTESLANFQKDPAAVIGHLKQSGKPIALTVEGRPEIIVQDAKSYERLLDLVDQAAAVEAVRKGVASMERGEGIPVGDALQQIRRKHDLPAIS